VSPSPTRARQRRLIADSILLGVVGAVAAQVFTLMLRGANFLFLHVLAGYQPPGLPTEGGLPVQQIGVPGLWLVPVATTLGGLLVGLLVEKLAPEAEGHGTDAVVKAFHQADGRLRARVAPVKLVASAITIGSGGSAGREGPIALVAAGIGSWYASVTNRSARDRRLLLLTGMAAGLSAIFRSPVGTVIMAIEVLYSDMEFEAGAGVGGESALRRVGERLLGHVGIVGGDGHHPLADVAHAIAREERHVAQLQADEHGRQVSAGHHRVDATQATRGARVDADDPRVRQGAAQALGEELARPPDVRGQGPSGRWVSRSHR